MLHTLTANWWALALRGLVAVLFGLLTFFLPGRTLVTLVLLFGAYALVDGVFNLIAFFRVASHQWALLIEGVVGIMGFLSLLFGLLILFAPDTGALAIVLWIGAYALVFGVFLLALAFRLRGPRRLIAQPT